MSLSSNQSTLLVAAPNSLVSNPVQLPVERIGSVTSRELVPRLDQYHNYLDSQATAGVPAAAFSLTETASSTPNPNVLPHSAETPNTAEVYTQSREPPTIREASDGNNHQLQTDFGSSGFRNTSAVVKRERSHTDTQGQATRDLVAVASNVQRTVSKVYKVAEIRRKLVIVGDTDCGKTALLMAISTGNFQNPGEPDNYRKYAGDVEVEAEGKIVSLELWDTSGRSVYDGLRPQTYSGSHVILMCFAIDSRNTFDNVQDKWIIEMLKHCKGVPVILVGCKKDLRGDHKAIAEIGEIKQKQVTYEEGEKVRRRMEAWYTYLECPAKTGEGIREVVEYATQATLVGWKLSKGGKPGVFRRMFSRSSS
ncbi:P-loop containing nucleoside triphosphate hydrolase protein [Stipitochalara longipes BDJ]|nr:P-loop containing nucleoside triphosphate hydrolase protein [Stipitochalara longipes BDJ]